MSLPNLATEHWRWVACAAGLATLLLAAILGRYTLVASNDQSGAIVYRLDRWTGNVVGVAPSGSKSIIPREAPPPR